MHHLALGCRRSCIKYIDLNGCQYILLTRYVGQKKNREQQKTLSQPFPLQISVVKYQGKKNGLKKSHTHTHI